MRSASEDIASFFTPTAVGIPADIMRRRPDIRQAERDRRDRLQESAETARRAALLSRTQYEAGLTDFTSVLDTAPLMRGRGHPKGWQRSDKAHDKARDKVKIVLSDLKNWKIARFRIALAPESRMVPAKSDRLLGKKKVWTRSK